MSIKSSHIPLIKSIKQSQMLTLSATDVLLNFVRDLCWISWYFFQKDVSPEWHYNEAHHGKDPMDGIGSTIKNLVYCKKLSGDVAIDTLKKFPEFANEISLLEISLQIACSYRKNSCWKNLKKSQRQPQHQQPWRYTKSSGWRRKTCL